MNRGRGYRGWSAAITLAVVLTFVFLAAEKYARTPRGSSEHSKSDYSESEKSKSAASRSARKRELPLSGIFLSLDPRLAGELSIPVSDQVPLKRQILQGETEESLRRPPEPAASVVLSAPVAMHDLVELPLHANGSTVDYLMDALDSALDSPMQTVSAEPVPIDVESPTVAVDLLTKLPSPESSKTRMPRPKALEESLSNLKEVMVSGFSGSAQRLVWNRSPFKATASEANAVIEWVNRSLATVDRLVQEHGLEHADGEQDLISLSELIVEGQKLGESLDDYALGSRVLRTTYALQRRTVIWKAIQQSLDGSSIALTAPRSTNDSKQNLLSSINRVSEKLGATGDAEAWRKFLLLDELATWQSSRGKPTASNQSVPIGDSFSGPTNTSASQLHRHVLSRLNWPRLTREQAEFLSEPVFNQLRAELIVWGQTAVDYRKLVSDLEELESNPISRVRTSVAGSTQVLRHAGGAPQQRLAQELNNHYRNANLRLCITDDLIERFLPNGEYEIRPVRQRILGADTRGNSAIETQMSLQLVPDDAAWNIGIGVVGNLHSNTRSSKGPAVFHNTSTAHISSQRYIRLDQQGYNVSSSPTNVRSQEYLRKMSTDYDSLPIIGDFVRLIVREQFDQKRGLAQRIARRLIAQETDAELDRRLSEGLEKAQHDLKRHLVGPLEGLSLNPIVVSMSTSEDRLTVRYRVASSIQMAAHTPRPRAPSDSLMSVQLHESSINNTIAQLGLSGRRWTLPELTQRLGEVLGQSDWELPLDVRNDVGDITVRFADTRPATVEMKDGRLRLTLRIAELSQPGRLHIEKFLVTSSYIPYASGLEAGLVRDGIVEIVSRRDRLALRLIFAKVFVSRPQIPIISETWQTDPRAQELAVSQLDILDGWMAVAISKADSALATEVATRARELQLR